VNLISIDSLSDAQIERALDKLRAQLARRGAAAPALASSGSITLVTGASAERPPRSGFSVLAAVSGSLLSLTKDAALELAPVRVNAILSGVVDTAIHAAQRAQIKSWAESALPTRRFGQPDDLAAAIELAMTNPYMTASTVTVDGGLLVI